MERWTAALTAVADETGNVTQLYPTWCSAGTNPAVAANGDLIRTPCEGILYSLQIKTDGTNGGYIQIYDISGIEIGVDVSSAAAITAAQLNAAITAGQAKKIYDQNFQAAPDTPIGIGYSSFQKGLAARFVSAAGACTLNLTTSGTYRKTTKVG